MREMLGARLWKPQIAKSLTLLLFSFVPFAFSWFHV